MAAPTTTPTGCSRTRYYAVCAIRAGARAGAKPRLAPREDARQGGPSGARLGARGRGDGGGSWRRELGDSGKRGSTWRSRRTASSR